MKRRHIEAARQHARDRLLGQFDWRTLADSEAVTVRPVRATKLALSEVEREILRLAEQGLRPQDLATLFSITDSDIEALLFGEAGTA